MDEPTLVAAFFGKVRDFRETIAGKPLVGDPHEEGRCITCGTLLPDGKKAYCNGGCSARDKADSED